VREDGGEPSLRIDVVEFSRGSTPLLYLSCPSFRGRFLVRIEIDFGYAKAPVDPLALDDDVDRDLEKVANIIALEVLSAV